MEKRWKRYAIFVSSTFVDMDAERDAIKYDVVNRLNRKYQQARIEFQVIDLRAGINTESLSEEDREDRVLDVCFSSIDTARPFFIGLLGGRYGWIPPQERIQHVLKRMKRSQRQLIGWVDGFSVTELEMLYGAIGSDGKYLDHSLFFRRTSESYAGIPDDKLRAFLDDANPELTNEQKEENRRKRKDLYEKISYSISNTRTDALLSEYTLRYNPGEDCFEGIETFSSLVFNQLSGIVDQEIGAHTSEEQIWSSQETEFSEMFQSRTVIETLDRTALISGMAKQVFLGGDAGVGKTVLLCQCYEKAPVGKDKKHIAFVGITPFATRIRTIILRWLVEMGAKSYKDRIPSSEELSNADLFAQFRKSAHEGGHIFFLDNPEELPLDEQGLAWIDKDIPIIVSGREESYKKIQDYNPDFHYVRIPLFTEKERTTFLNNNGFGIPEKVFHAMEIGEQTPEKMELLLNVLNGLSTRDFQQIRSRGNGGISEINRYLEQLYDEFSGLGDEMFIAVLKRVITLYGWQAKGLRAFHLLSLSPLGLRESDLERLMGPDWDPVTFVRILYYFSNFFVQDPNTLCWRICSRGMKAALQAGIGNKQDMYRELTFALLALPDHDMLKRDILIYFAIKAHCPLPAISFLATRDHFSDYDDVSAWYFFATSYLGSDTDSVRDLECTCEVMPDSGKAVFLRHYYEYGCGFSRRMEENLYLVRKALLSANVSEMDAISAFYLGWLMTHAALYQRVVDNDPEKREKELLLAVEGFQRAISLDPGNAAARNMISAVGTDLLDVYIQQNRFDDFNRLYSLLNTN